MFLSHRPHLFISGVIGERKANLVSIMRSDSRSQALLTNGVVEFRLRGDEALEEIVGLLQIHVFHDAAEDVRPDLK